MINDNVTIFFGNSFVDLNALWKSDGTPEGTVLVKLLPTNPNYPNHAVQGSQINVNGTLFFTHDDGMHGLELWKSDGTPEGTVLVKDVNTYIYDSDVNNLTNVSGTLYFTADDWVHGQELWKSDGTPEGTVLVKDIAPEIGSDPLKLTNVNGNLFFTADDGTSGYQLWVVQKGPEATISGKIVTDTGVPLPGVVVTLSGWQAARTITDSNGFYSFTGIEIGKSYTVTPSRVDYVFSPATLSFDLSGEKTDAAFTATEGAATANPLDTNLFFVRQQYLDFLGREPDQGGLNYWTIQLDRCGSNAGCLHRQRIDVSAAFFIEQELQQTAFYIYRLYAGPLGRRPTYAEFAADRTLIVGGANLEAGKAAFADAFVRRAEFVQKYQAATTAEAFVDALIQVIKDARGVDLSAQRSALIAKYNTGANLSESRSLTVRAIIENDLFKAAEYNRAFVLMQYFGYLKREPDQAGYDFWLNVLNNREPNNYRGMVCSFVTSAEYQNRFSPIVTRSNSDCAQ
ncbi:MAG: ELWxxDGT repeat protein, partial [Pyrinomonadaceae bacterium]